MTERTKGPWDQKTDPQFSLTPEQERAAQLQAGLLDRLSLMARYNKYEQGEAQDISKAAGEAAMNYIDTTAPDADALVITAVPFRTDIPNVSGNSISQSLKSSPAFDQSLRQDIIPRFASIIYPTFGAKLRFAVKVLFSRSPVTPKE